MKIIEVLKAEMNKSVKDMKVEIEINRENPNQAKSGNEKFWNLNRKFRGNPYQQNTREEERIPGIENTKE